jgi:hypothetical protein
MTRGPADAVHVGEGVLSCSRLIKNAAQSRMARIIQSPIEHDDPQLACDHEQVGAHVVGD